MAGKRRASSAVSSSCASRTTIMSGGDMGQPQRQRSHSSAMQSQPHQLQQQQQQHHHRGSISGGILNGLRKVHLFRRNTLDNSRIRQPLMEESQVVSITPHHHQLPQANHSPQQPTSNAMDCLMEITTDIKATIEEEDLEHDQQLSYNDAMKTAAARTLVTSPTSTQMPGTTTKATNSYQNLSSNTTTALVSISTATATNTALPSHPTHFLTASAACAPSAEISSESRNGNRIRGPQGHPYKPATSIVETSLCSNKDIASCAGGGGDGGGGLVLVTTTNNNLSLHDHRMVVDEAL